MPTDCNPKLFAFEAVERKKVIAAFDGGAVTCNAGALLLGRGDHVLALIGHRSRRSRFTNNRLSSLLAR